MAGKGVSCEKEREETGKRQDAPRSTIEKAVACFDSIVNLFGTGIVVDLPEAKADDGHLLAIVEFDGGRRHIDWLQVSIASVKSSLLYVFWMVVKFNIH